MKNIIVSSFILCILLSIVFLSGCTLQFDSKTAKITNYSIPYSFHYGESITAVITVRNINPRPVHLCCRLLDENSSVVIAQSVTPMLIYPQSSYNFIFHFVLNQQVPFYGIVIAGNGNCSNDDLIRFTSVYSER